MPSFTSSDSGRARRSWQTMTEGVVFPLFLWLCASVLASSFFVNITGISKSAYVSASAFSMAPGRYLNQGYISSRGRHLPGPGPNGYRDCPLDCGVGGACVPDPSPTFGDLLKFHLHRSDSDAVAAAAVLFRCDCSEGYSGSRCQTFREEANSNANGSENENENTDDDFFPDDFFMFSDECPLDCQNEGRCITIFGGLSFACICVKPYWGSECELDGSLEPCELDCSSIVSTLSSEGDADEDGIEDGNISGSRHGAFCILTPENETSGVNEGDSDGDGDNDDDQTCVHCEEISQEDEPDCEGLLECKNGGVCKVDYQFVSATASDSSEGGDATVASERPLKCSATMTTTMLNNGIEGSSMQTIWTDLPPYTLSCDCPPGFQGETCEEIDVCGGCQNDGYCISRDTPGDQLFDTDDIILNFGTDDSNFDDDNGSVYNDDGDDDDDGFDDDDDDGFDDDDDDGIDDDGIDHVSGDSDCTCYSGGCVQTLCGAGASCVGGRCNQNHLINPMCPGGKCSQRNTVDATCTGGDCDQTSAVEATCAGTDCFYDEIKAQTMTTAPSLEPFCSCGYGYVGDLCQHTMTTICLFDEYNFNQLLHEFCLKAGGGFCPLDVGDRFCTNGGTCGNIDNIMPDITMTDNFMPNNKPAKPEGNGKFSCNCPSGFEGVHCEVVITQAPSAEPTAQPTDVEPAVPLSSGYIPGKFYTLVFAVLFAIFWF